MLLAAYMTHNEVVVLFLALGILLTAARVLGELARWLRQPAVIGEILAGILLGPTVLGALAPGVSAYLFPSEGAVPVVLEGMTTFAVTLFLLVAGMEVDLSMMLRLKKPAALIGIFGFLVPFTLGFALAYLFPGFAGMQDGANRFAFSLFLGTALAIVALPVIAKILMDMNLFRSDLGMLVIAVAILLDLLGWIIFAIILGMINPEGGSHGAVAMTIIMTLGFVVLTLTVGRWAINRLLPWVQAHTSWPGGVLGAALSVGLLGAAATEWIGVHAMFGAFLVGVALGDSPHLQQRTRSIIEEFISFIFAPLFLASIGLRVDFLAWFDPGLTLVILVIACVAGSAGCAFGARLTGMAPRRAWATGFALNARGAMGIILALLAREYGVIDDRLFVALVVMALVTSLIAAPAMQWVLQRKTKASFRSALSAKTFIPRLQDGDRWSVIQQLAAVAEGVAGLPAATIAAAVRQREEIMTTALPGGLAIPHARLANLPKPVVAIGLSPQGVDFDSPDGKLIRLVMMILTPVDMDQTQLELLADIAKTFRRGEAIAKAAASANYTEFLAMLNIHGGAGEPLESAHAPAS
jgi:Kef-type K+ transport system membrane component KefB/mannitol/fructose-specific phosphotransferase system IIA component (Ntr-type)